jgi:hypothetical protein
MFSITAYPRMRNEKGSRAPLVWGSRVAVRLWIYVTCRNWGHGRCEHEIYVRRTNHLIHAVEGFR